jgi:RIO kinase 1
MRGCGCFVQASSNINRKSVIGKSNPRKMVKVWAEKEMRNYRRLHAASIPCPKPILLKSHVLIMEFLGLNGWPSPRLKDAQLKEKRMRQAYVQTILIMRHMFQRCRLVHGDLSEYNLLWHDNQVYVIDVSQSVESDHPSALDFLRKDASNVNDFFSKAGNLSPMTTRQLFDFITSTVIDNTEEAESKALDEIIDDVEKKTDELSKANIMEKKAWQQQTDVDEAVFMSQFLPRSLNQVAEQDIRMIEEGEVEETYAYAVAALTGNKDVVNAVANKIQGKKLSTFSNKKDDIQEHDEDSLYDDEVYEDSPSEEDTSNAGHLDADGRFIKRVKTAEEITAEKASKRAAMKAHKKAVKESRSEKRQTKIKKKDKKRAINKTKGNKKK